MPNCRQACDIPRYQELIKKSEPCKSSSHLTIRCCNVYICYARDKYICFHSWIGVNYAKLLGNILEKSFLSLIWWSVLRYFLLIEEGWKHHLSGVKPGWWERDTEMGHFRLRLRPHFPVCLACSLDLFPSVPRVLPHQVDHHGGCEEFFWSCQTNWREYCTFYIS